MDSLTFSHACSVLYIFLIPFGGGIPAGVILAKSHGLDWQLTAFIYFVSDVILALIFEPFLMFFIAVGKKSKKVSLIGDAFRQSTQKTLAQYGNKAGPFALILISFGVDPMTGRSAAVAAGHGFIRGWIFAITGDMFYFSVLMVSTLWLNGILGDGTITTLIIMVLMFVVPAVIRKAREKARGKNATN